MIKNAIFWPDQTEDEKETTTMEGKLSQKKKEKERERERMEGNDFMECTILIKVVA